MNERESNDNCNIQVNNSNNDNNNNNNNNNNKNSLIKIPSLRINSLISNFVLIVCFYQDTMYLVFKRIKQNLSIVWIKKVSNFTSHASEIHLLILPLEYQGNYHIFVKPATELKGMRSN